ncbi:MAG TPA: serine protease, partial [Pirellulales bacterium]|nr:serine protease [Pirellulales bacterium]
EFKHRISKAEWPDPSRRPTNVRETRNWVVGENGRTHGSLHCDWWLGQAVELALCNKLAVYPVSGWWKDRPHLARYDRKARYSLVVSIEAPGVDVDLYTPITTYNTVQTELMI